MKQLTIMLTVQLACALWPCQATQQPSQASDSSHKQVASSPQQAKTAIQLFLKRTALRIIELEWTFGYNNQTPSASDRATAMLAGDMSQCPADFQQAWINQVRRPERNYIAPILRRYDISLADLRKELSRELQRIDPTVRPPIPLYDEDETPEKFDPMTCGTQRAILAAIAKLEAKLSGIDPAQAKVWKEAVTNVMIEFSLNFMETTVCMHTDGIPRQEVAALFDSINVQACPENFRNAWAHDLTFFKNGQFNSPELQLSPICRQYGVNEITILNFVKRKMREWGIGMPRQGSQDQFRHDMQELRNNLMSGRKIPVSPTQAPENRP